jgi:hypothetical protein
MSRPTADELVLASFLAESSPGFVPQYRVNQETPKRYYFIDLARWPVAIEVEGGLRLPHHCQTFDPDMIGYHPYRRLLWLLSQGWHVIAVATPYPGTRDQWRALADQVLTYTLAVDSGVDVAPYMAFIARTDGEWLVTEGWLREGQLEVLKVPPPPWRKAPKRLVPETPRTSEFPWRWQKREDPARGQRILARRLALGLSRNALSKLSGVSNMQLKLYEDGWRIYKGHWSALASALQADAPELFLGLLAD